MKKCPTCGAEYPAEKLFCPTDGSELEAVGGVTETTEEITNATAENPDSSGTQQDASTNDQSGNVVTVLSWTAANGSGEERSLPIAAGMIVQVAREGSTKLAEGVASLAIPAAGVSNTPLQVTERDGVLYVKDLGTSNGVFIAKRLTKDDPEMAVDPRKGEFIISNEEMIFTQ